MLSFRESLQENRLAGRDPRQLLSEIYHGDPTQLFSGHEPSDEDIWRVLMVYASSVDLRYKRVERQPIENLDSALTLFKNSNRIVVILGAGGSVGPDFRSPGGLYDSIAKAGVLDDPYDVFDLNKFKDDPTIFWQFAHTIFPSSSPEHSAAHNFVASLEKAGKLQRVYSQNVDTLEYGVPEDKLRCVHGSWRVNHCMGCHTTYGIEDLRSDVESRQIPRCRVCDGFIQPGIVFFGQATNLDDEEVCRDAEVADLLVVIGTSLRVAPISELPDLMGNIPAILINRTPVTCSFNAQLLGECSDIISMIEKHLGWKDEGREREDVQFYEPNTYVMPSDTKLGTRIVETPRATFLVTAATCDIKDYE